MCLLQCGPRRLHYNFTQYRNAYTPEFWEGGGGWSQLKFSLGSLYEEHDYLRNKWTKSNVLLPLVRYLGCKFKFWREWDMDYIVYYSTCLPMLDTLYQHINAHPYNMLLYKHKILIKSLRKTKNKKPYKKLFIKPPEQFRNTWYFQADFANQGLCLLTTTAADFTRPYLNPKSLSNSITIRCLNTKIFRNHNFKQSRMGTALWSPNNDLYYYITKYDHGNKIKDLIYCGQTTTFTLGQPIGTQQEATDYCANNKWNINFAHILHPQILHNEVTLWVSKHSPRVLFNDKSKRETSIPTDTENLQITQSTDTLIKKVRYNPDKDRGNSNLIYFLPLYTNVQNWDPTEDIDLQTDGYPLWCLLWGWEDWIKKYKKLQNMDTDYILAIRTDTMSETMTEYIPIDITYTEGHSPYQDQYNPIDYNTWQPCLRTQMLSIEDICVSGPLTCKTSTQSIEAHCTYDFIFKWGGCANQLENITDPEKQKHYPTPHNFFESVQIQNPEQPPESNLYPFDFRRHILTATATKRIKKDFSTTTFSQTDTKFSCPTTTTDEQTPQEEIQQTQTTEEEEAPLLQQLQLLRDHRHQLQQQLQQLISRVPRIKY